MVASNSWWLANAGGASSFYGHDLNYSVRTNGGEYMSRSESGDVKKWTFSCWIKPRGPTWFGEIWSSAGSGHAGGADIEYLALSDGIIYHYQYRSGTLDFNLQSRDRIRDNGNWTHLVVVKDTAQSTDTNRLKYYLNGTLVTNFSSSTYVAQDSSTGYINSSLGQMLFHEAARSRYPTYAYFSEMHFCDAQAYAASDFGEFKEGVWIPIEPDVSYGTTGWHLDFADSSALGNDVSGNNNDWSTSNFVAADRTLDNPTNNFATMNSLQKSYAALVYSEGNLNVTGTGSAGAATYATCASTMELKGKVYFEAYVNGLTGVGRTSVGIVGENYRMDRYGSIWTVGVSGFDQEGDLAGVNTGDDDWNTAKGGNASTETTIGYTGGGSDVVADAGDVIQIAYDADTGYAWYGVINRDSSDAQAWFNSGNPAGGTGYVGILDTAVKQFACGILQSSSDSLIFNFGQDGTFSGYVTAQGNTDGNGIGNFYGAVPSGFLAVCSRNLPDYTIGPSASDQADDHFDTATWVGDDASTRAITTNFQADFTWIRNRTDARHYVIHDSVSGTGAAKTLDTATEYSEGHGDMAHAGNGFLSAFASGSFTVSHGSSTAEYVNEGSDNYVGWHWKGGASTTNDASSTGVGSIDSTYKANTDAGFSIVTYTGTGSDGTIAHGLSSKPQLIITKSRSDSDHWYTYSEFSATANPEQYELYLNLTIAVYKDGSDNTRAWNATAPTSTVFSVGDTDGTNESGDTHMAYCFHSVDGFSKHGFYKGNGNADGTFVYTGFSPKFVMIRSLADGRHWVIKDSARDTYNPATKTLLANSTSAEDTSSSFDIDFLSSGFKCRTSSAHTNTSGETHIYMAFASLPFKHSNGRT